jgi:hypothetical protein
VTVDENYDFLELGPWEAGKIECYLHDEMNGEGVSLLDFARLSIGGDKRALRESNSLSTRDIEGAGGIDGRFLPYGGEIPSAKMEPPPRSLFVSGILGLIGRGF